MSTLDRRGLWMAIGAYALWGVMPLYWHLLSAVPALQIVLHRIVWSALFVGGYLLWRDGRHWLRRTLAQPRLWWMLLLSGLLIACNWGLYIWAVNAGHVVESALGYFINPLFNVLLGVLLLRERLRPLQWLAVALAALGVLWLALQHGRLPWIALALAGSFGLYGLLRKLAHVDAVAGLGVESAYLLPPALLGLAWYALQTPGGLFAGSGAGGAALLVFGGVVTALPLVGFAYAVRRVPLATVGLLQYLSPTLQFLIGVFVFAEPFDRSRLVGFACIWLALAVFVADGIRHGRRQRAQALAELA